MADESTSPLAAAIRSFGVSGETTKLTGGQGGAVRIGDVVLKPCEQPGEWAGLAPILAALRPSGYRIARPIFTEDGACVSFGWMATQYVHGEPGYATNELQALGALKRFHTDMRIAYGKSVCPPWLGKAHTIWSTVDRIAWGEDELQPELAGWDAAREFEAIVGLLEPVDELDSQITHGDPGGDNILFAPGADPAIIDVSPYWRPAEYGTAMMLADGVAWENSDPSSLELARQEPFIGQMLIRAVLFRLSVAALTRGTGAVDRRLEAYEPVINWVTKLS